MRRFVLSTLRDFGMGKKAIEEKIIEESQHLINVLKEKHGKAFDTTQPVSYAISNIINSVVFGSRFEYDDSVFTSMVDQNHENARLFQFPSVQVLLHIFYCSSFAS
ncbi:hypothetical protein LDENG_00286380 [Lucifuga dentata]|nr:hypothetical protein LDENG_00286380 [Lucifuga dentata]